MRQRGFTMVEVLISVGIMSVVAFFALDLVVKLMRSDAEMSAADGAEGITTLILGRLESDLKYRDLTTICNSTVCTTFTVSRLDPNGTATYQVTYTSSCEVPPANVPMETFPVFNTFTAQQSLCIRTLNCPTGQYPRVSWTVAGSTLPYPNPQPALGATAGAGRNSLANSPVGAAVCLAASVTAAGNVHEDITVEVAFMRSSGVVSLERKKSVVSTAALGAGIQLLPQ